MTALLTLVHVFVCIVLIAAVLLQSGKAADLAGAFGGGGSSTSFGPRSTQSILARLTTACAILFMVTSLGLWLVGNKQSGSVLKETPAVTDKAAATEPAPTTPSTEQKQKPAAAEQKATEKAPPTQPQTKEPVTN